MSDGTLAITRLSGLANPTRFVALAGRMLPWLWGVTLALLAVGLFMALTAPDDYQQGSTVHIMYIHVPSAWLAMLCYTLMTASSIGTLVWRHPLADVAAKAAAPIGAVFTFTALVTGALWGRPTWGTYWVWDARLTSFLILFIMYLGLIALVRAIDDPSKSARVAAVLTVVGFINIPIIKFSVDWWNTLHQSSSVLTMQGSQIAPSLLWPLLVMALAFTMLFFTLHVVAMRTEIWRRRVTALRRQAARQAR
ncbi:heme ABC transporter permease [Pararhizobium mangrovi]|uniref:Heme exporter protein C n=1 Tax=Pararhizobium mangrovi TaxID=2590452 RepID=A0A506TZR8_9HYPH|nr:heme ABC transporter permease [Pararhizobium mangrovi]TPW27010.1 heme ABC transporter permease [Pararhizobium mangrovi]